jgi:hypothetical protein
LKCKNIPVIRTLPIRNLAAVGSVCHLTMKEWNRNETKGLALCNVNFAAGYRRLQWGFAIRHEPIHAALCHPDTSPWCNSDGNGFGPGFAFRLSLFFSFSLFFSRG